MQMKLDTQRENQLREAEELLQPLSLEEASLISGGRIEGTWNRGTNSVFIRLKNKNVTADWIGNNRPDGKGTLLSTKPFVINVLFPDDGRYIGTLINQRQIQWSRIGKLRTNVVWNR